MLDLHKIVCYRALDADVSYIKMWQICAQLTITVFLKSIDVAESNGHVMSGILFALLCNWFGWIGKLISLGFEMLIFIKLEI